MGELTRFGVSMEAKLLAEFDKLCERRAYANRSEAIRDLIRDFIVEEEWRKDDAKDLIGTLTLVYDHHTRAVQDRLTALQHEAHGAVISTLHVHLDAHRCLEVLILRGSGPKLRKLADRLIATRGVLHGKLTATAAGKKF